MHFKEVQLTHFRNYAQLRLTLHKGINCVVGDNGQGKTNLIEALCFLATAKSPLTHIDRHCVQFGTDEFLLFGLLPEDMRVACSYQLKKGKTIRWNDENIYKRSELLGRIPVVFTGPGDTQIIREGSEVRRKLFDQLLTQLNPNFLPSLLEYQSVLKQRNELLKSSRVDDLLLDAYDTQMIRLSKNISTDRNTLMENFRPFFEANYRLFHPGETPSIRFESSALNPDFEDQFRRQREKDKILQHSSLGCHRDNFHLDLSGEAIRHFGSQGQQKTFILSIHLAQYDLLWEKLNQRPILLLDDVLDKLDDQRVSHLLELLQTDRFEQVFITEARKNRMKQYFQKDSVNFVEVDNGKITHG